MTAQRASRQRKVLRVTELLLPEGWDPTDPDINEVALPHEEFRAMRQNAPIHWVEQIPEAGRIMIQGALILLLLVVYSIVDDTR